MFSIAEKASEILETEHMVIVADNGYDSVSDVVQVVAVKNIPVVTGGDYEFWYPATEEEAEEVTDYDETIVYPVYLPDRTVSLVLWYDKTVIWESHIFRFRRSPKQRKNCHWRF